ncbi:MAG: hypothetical protein WDN69_26920 [Aliidongia sp.]
MPPATRLSSLPGATFLSSAAPADPHQEIVAVMPIAVQMHAIGAGAEERHGTAIEFEQQRAAPACGDGESLAADPADRPFLRQKL